MIKKAIKSVIVEVIVIAGLALLITGVSQFGKVLFHII